MIKQPLSTIKDLFTKRRVAYGNVFDRQNVFTHTVLQDLAKFCRAQETTFHQDERVSLMLQGRREVWLRITEYLNLSEDELLKLHQVKADK